MFLLDKESSHVLLSPQMTCAVLLLLFLRPEGTPYIRGIRLQFTPALPAAVALVLCMYPRTVSEASPTQIAWLSILGKVKLFKCE